MATTTTTTTLPITLESTGTIFYGSTGAIETVTKHEGGLSFGTIAPGETGNPIIVSFSAPLATATRNIKIGLIDTGGITFTNTTFGITARDYIDYDITPSTYFQGVNTNGSETNAFNISVENKDSTSSYFVYLNIKLPQDYTLTTGILRYKWFFDYAD